MFYHHVFYKLFAHWLWTVAIAIGEHFVDPLDKGFEACLSPIALLHMAIKHKRNTDRRTALQQHQQQQQQNRFRRHSHGDENKHDDDNVDYDDTDDDNEPYAVIDDSAQITPDMFLDMCPLMLLQIDQRACADDVRMERVPEPPSYEQNKAMCTFVCIPSLSASVLYNCDRKSHTHTHTHSLVVRVRVDTGHLHVRPARRGNCAADQVGRLPACARFSGRFGCGHAVRRRTYGERIWGVESFKKYIVSAKLYYYRSVTRYRYLTKFPQHLLPHALTSHQHGDPVQPAPTLFTNGDRAFEPVWLLFCTFMTALGMYALETALPLLGHQSSTGHGHGHSHGHGHGHGHQHAPIEMKPIEEESGGMVGRMLAEPQTKKRRQRQSLSPVALMVLLGDGLHNVTDGMAIGAAFAVDPVTGFATALAVLCHELPHELGDFALLLQTGVSVRRALAFNVLSSVLSVLGMCAGLAVGGVSATMVRWIYAGTAGTFLYIALADLVPEMRSGGGGGGDAGRQRSAGWLVAVQVVGVLAGGLLMLAIALYEERLKTLFD